ncbi:MAG: D-alanine--D-alanine ligase family protein [Thermodesulfobacteriota bacterium]
MEGLELKVAILYNLLERLEREEEKDILAEQAVLEEIGAVEESLLELGYQPLLLPIRNEIESILQRLIEIRPDVVFNLCDCVYGKAMLEMAIPALLDLLRIPYTGSPPLTLGLCLDKGKVKDFLTSHGILTPKYKIVDSSLTPIRGFLFPLIVKPLREDGSLGISKESVVYDNEGLNRQIQFVLNKYQQPALVEEYIEGRELNVALIELNGEVKVLAISEIDYSEFPEGIPKICGYEAKWIADSIEFQKSKPICPAPLDWVLEKRVEYLATKVFKLFDCRDYARVDMRVDPEGKIYVLEVNPNPDISPQSGMARAIHSRGMTYTDFIKIIIDNAYQRRDQGLRD